MATDRHVQRAWLWVALALALLPGLPLLAHAPAAAGPLRAAPTVRAPTALPTAPMATGAPGAGAEPPYYLGGHIAPLFVPGPGRPAPATVNPTALYSSEPAPMGLGDFGLTSSGSPYTYYTDRFEASAHLGSLSIGPVSASTGNTTSLQLNVVVTMSRGSRLAEYWIQDVPLYDASNHLLYLENNVWNFSGGNTLPSNSISGNGSVYRSGSSQYYADGPGSSYPGNNVYLTLPVNISVMVTASNLSGSTHVGFLYDDGRGWVIYDNVTFPYTKGWTFHGFEVNGSAYNPFGTFDDAEWVIAGPGGGSEDKDVASDLNLTLDYDNGRNLESVPNAYDFGSDTAETVTNANPSFPTRAPTGAPADRFRAGAGSLAYLFGPSKVATVNVSAPVVDGTLLVNGTPTAYRGRSANLTVDPGSYRFADENGSSLFASRNVTVSAGQYFAFSFAEAHLSPSSADSLANVTASGTGFAPSATVSLLWPGNRTPQCNGTVARNGSFSCSFQVPIVADGSYNLTAVDNATSGDRALLAFRVTTNLSLTARPSIPETETGQSVRFQAEASAGFPPYATYQWRFGDGSSNSTTGNVTRHVFSGPGNYTVVVTVTDRIGDTATTALLLPVVSAVAAARPAANRSSADIGQGTTFTVSAAGGVAPYGYTWQGLPGECRPSGASAACAQFVLAGNYSITVAVNDSLGYAATSAPLAFRVFARPTITAVTEGRRFVDVGGNLTLTASGDPGAGRLTYAWSGLPSGCGGAGPVISCRPNATGPFDAQVSAVDANGVASGSGGLAFTIYSDPSVRFSPSGPLGRDAGETLHLAAEVSGGSGDAAFVWTRLPGGCAPGNVSTIACPVEVAGRSTLLLTYTDRAGWTVGASALLTVAPALTASWLVGPPAPVDRGIPVTLDLATSGGSGGVSYDWAGLPSGCAGGNGASLTCSPDEAGTFPIHVVANDSNGGTAMTPTLSVTVNPLPSATSFTASPSTLLVGEGLRLVAVFAGGTGPYSYQWAQLPPGCVGGNAASLSCSPTGPGHFVVQLTVTDSFQRSTNTTVSVHVLMPVLGLPPSEGYLVISAAVAIATLAVVAGAWGWRRRRRDPVAAAVPGSAGPRPP